MFVVAQLLSLLTFIFSRTIMAAALSVINGGAFGTRTTKGLFLICTLLSLIHFSSSMFEKEQLKQMQKTQQYIKEEVQKLKYDQKSTIEPGLELLNYYSKIMDSMKEVVKKYTEDLPEDFPPVEQFLKNAKSFFDETRAYVMKKNAELGVKIENIEKSIGQTQKYIEFFEEFQAEL